ncbi:surfactant protein C-like [Mixophyes fleayi]|uniref:surfactant protein C-like n=1 Tax=Mixophyes fleayi TaxID=3061075 RepID=UPI003F4E2628
MEQKSPEQLSMDLPPYTRFSKPTQTRKKWIVGTALGVLLAGIVVGAALIGVYMTQKHTEAMVTMAFHSDDGESSQQTISVDEQENVAFIFISTSKYSASVLFDYKRNIIGIRMSNSSSCYVLSMDKFKTPSLHDILSSIKYLQANNTPLDDTITYSFTLGEEANRRDLGINVNILCSDVAIYWAKTVNRQNRKTAEGDITVIVIVIKNDENSLALS